MVCSPDRDQMARRGGVITAEEVRAFAERHVEHWKKHDSDAISSDHAETSVVESPSAGTHQGREAIRKNLQRWIDSFPDITFEAELIVADENSAAIMFSVHGAQQGEFFGLPAAGQHLEFRGVLIQEIADGQIVHERRIYDFSGVLTKLGVLKLRPA